MKKILIISDGEVGKHFIERVIDTYTTENIYYVIETKASNFEDVNPGRFKFYEFDPTSFYKLSNVLKMEFIQVIVCMDNRSDLEITLKNIRNVKKQIRVIVLDQWDMKLTDPNTVTINSNELLASRLIDYLPNVPVIAQNVGLGEGEIMEVLVPFGSSFVYRHIGVIEQKNWRIVAIYRNRQLIMPSRRRMIQPNDLLVMVGQPPVLQSVYRAIKRELGQFPAPFGSNIYLYIDMARQGKEEIERCLEHASFIHGKFPNQLVIKVINPGDIDLLRHIKSYRESDTIIDICYALKPKTSMILSDIKKYHIGLVLVTSGLFEDQELRRTIYDGNVPVLKLAKRPFSNIKDAVLLLSGNRDLEKVSTTVFDVSSQLGLNLELIKYTHDHYESADETIEHYNNLSTIFSKSNKVIEMDHNPIRELQKKENFLQCLPFSEKIVERPLLSMFSTDSETLYHRLDSYHQIFIPVRI